MISERAFRYGDPETAFAEAEHRISITTRYPRSPSAPIRTPASRQIASKNKGLFRFLTWCCVAILAFLSLLPAKEMVPTGFPGQLEHFVAYAGSAAIAMSGYGLNRKAPWVIGYLEQLPRIGRGR